MKQETKDDLLEYLGELTYDLENEAEYFKKGRIVEKLKAIHTILNLQFNEPNWRINYREIVKLKSKPNVNITDDGAKNIGMIL